MSDTNTHSPCGAEDCHSSPSDDRAGPFFGQGVSEVHPIWKVLIADDEKEVHRATKLVLKDFSLDDRGLVFLSAFSSDEAKELLAGHPDIALVLLDVSMDSPQAGLNVVRYVREELKNPLVRIVLRTEGTGEFPEDATIDRYDIHDYRVKSEATTRKLYVTVLTALRSFRTFARLEASKRELEKIAASYARFVPHEFLQFLERESIVDVQLGDRSPREMSILFSDIRSFTSLSESMTPRENFDFLNRYLSYVSPVIRQHNGFIDKYIGDAILALFPQTTEDAVRAAIEMQRQVTSFDREQQSQGRHPVAAGIGVHAGNLILGTIGEDRRMETTVISNAVNLASQLEGLTKVYGAKIAISVQALSSLENSHEYQYRFLDRVSVKGKQAPVAVFEIYDGDLPEQIDRKHETHTDFEQGIFLYFQQRFQEAKNHFQRVLAANPDDRAADLYEKRCEMSDETGQLMPLEGLRRTGKKL